MIIDIDECKRSNGECDHHCNNTNGSYYCSCNDGYSLGKDNLSCKGICVINAMQLGNKLLLYLQFSDNDECQVDNGGCPQSCNNTSGSYHCQCWNGYKMNNDSVCTGMYSRGLNFYN